MSDELSRAPTVASAVLGLIGVLIITAATAAPADGCSATRYRIVGLPFTPTAINASGRIAGNTASHRAAVWTDKDGVKELPVPTGYTRTDAVAINKDGHVLVMAYDQTLQQHQGFVYARGRLTPLPGAGVRAYALSDAGRVAGEALVDGKAASQPVYWDKFQRKEIGNCCGGTAKGVNAAGLVTGDLYDPQGRYGAFSWTADGGTRPIGPPGNFSSAIAVNAAGTVVVQGFPDIYLRTADGLERITLSPRFPSHPRGINKCNVIVGAFGPFSDADRAFVWDKSAGFRDLNSAVPSGSGWTLEAAVAINDRGEIVGRGDHKGDDDGGFLLLPETE